MTGHRAHDVGTANLAPRDRWRWQEYANCRGESVNLFFSADGEKPHEREAREAKALPICRDCPLQTVCRDDAIARNDYWGIRGGLTPDEIVAERRRRMRSGAMPSMRRQGLCAQGHELTEENSLYDRRGFRRCRTCDRARHRRSKGLAA